MRLSEKAEKLGIGLMSGTSLDGVDAALVRIKGSGLKTEVSFQCGGHLSYDVDTREKLKAICDVEKSDVRSICEMNFILGDKFAKAVWNVLNQCDYSIEDIDFISSHGQTIYHIPPGNSERATPSTLQIGDISVIAQLTGEPVIGDFRTADMAAGGHGAPLVPYVDYLLFHDEKKARAIQNIGGIANVTFLPAGGTRDQVIAYDTGPGNMLIDQVVEEITEGRQIYDRDGQMAAQGKVDERLLKQWMSDAYYLAAPPKTTGREKYGRHYVGKLMKEAGHLSGDDRVATVTALTAHSIADSYRRFILSNHQIDEMVISGGGSHNPVLVEMIKRLLPEVDVVQSDAYGLNSDFKEAVAFVVLANEFIHGIPNNLPSATGALHSAVLGKLAVPGPS